LWSILVPSNNLKITLWLAVSDLLFLLLHCLSSFDWLFLTCFSCYCIVCPPLIGCFWLAFLVIALSVLLWLAVYMELWSNNDVNIAPINIRCFPQLWVDVFFHVCLHSHPFLWDVIHVWKYKKGSQKQPIKGGQTMQ
jgi:hypothetical protein